MPTRRGATLCSGAAISFRLQAAIFNLASLGEGNLYDVELETLNLARRELVKVEADMAAAGQTP